MNNDNDEIQDLILQLKQLQLEQTRLQQKQTKITTRLERLSEGTENANKKADATQKFAIGKRVRIINPGPLQATTGTIVKIGTGRITVQTRNGDKIIRVAKNLIIEKRMQTKPPAI
jgi:dsDNA-specific endonuclease/ATPase MutS2